MKHVITLTSAALAFTMSVGTVHAQSGLFWEKIRSNGQNSVQVTGSGLADLDRAISRSLSARLGEQAGSIAVNITRIDLDPTKQTRQRRQVSVPLVSEQFYDAQSTQCGRQTLRYTMAQGSVFTQYRLRYTVTGPLVKDDRGEARGRVSAPFEQAEDPVISSRCGTQRASQEDIRRLGATRFQEKQPLEITRASLANDIARQISDDLRIRQRTSQRP
ncbi:MAG: hypothetical protein AAGA36_03465 [Pseudomonadota bacterium]